MLRPTYLALFGCTLLDACDDEPTAAPRPAIADPTGFAVLSSDWSATAVSLLDECSLGERRHTLCPGVVDGIGRLRGAVRDREPPMEGFVTVDPETDANVTS